MTFIEDLFLTRIKALAKLCNFALDTTIVALYERALQSHGLDNASHAIEQIILNRKDRDPFPSVRAIIGIIKPEINEEHEAIEAVARIVQSVSRIGRYRGEEAKEYIGSLGWRVVERFGGWAHVCENLGSNLHESSFIAQARQLAKATLSRASSGSDDVAPVIPMFKKRSNELTSSKQLLGNFQAFCPEDEPPKGA
jgi:hypothetical protein